jgi:hypothetical protein
MMPMRPPSIQEVPESWQGPLPVYDPVRTIGMNPGSDGEDMRARQIALLKGKARR